MGRVVSYVMENKSHVWNHQPDKMGYPPNHPTLDHFSIEQEEEPHMFWGSPIPKKPLHAGCLKTQINAADFSSLQPGIQSIGNKTNHKLDVVLLSPAWGHWKVGKRIGQMQNKGISHDFTIFHLQPLMSPSSMVWTSFMGWFQRNMQETINFAIYVGANAKPSVLPCEK